MATIIMNIVVGQTNASWPNPRVPIQISMNKQIGHIYTSPGIYTQPRIGHLVIRRNASRSHK